MTKSFRQLETSPARLRVNLWIPGAMAIAGLVLAPILSILWIAVTPTENICRI